MDALLDGKITQENRQKAKEFMLPILADSRIERIDIGDTEETRLLNGIRKDYLYYLTAKDNYHDLTLGIEIINKTWNYEYSYKEKIEKLNKILKGKGEEP